MAESVYALVGNDSLLQQEALAAIAAALPRDAQRADFEGETASLADVLDELRSFAMFGGGKLVVIRNADEFVTRFRAQMEDYVASSVQGASSSSTLVLRMKTLPGNQRIAKLIAKHGKVEACEPPKDLAKWVMGRGKKYEVTVTADGAALLADLIGADLGRLDNELAKLSLGESKTVDAEQIAGSVTFQRDRQMWDLTNALGEGRADEAITRWRQLVQGDSSAEFRAVTWLTMWLENVRKALGMLRDRKNAFEIGQALRIWPRELQGQFVKTTQALGDRGVRRAVDLLAKMDYQTKTGVGDAAENVERFLLGLAVHSAT